ncbi:MAG: hypothetical protein IKI58_11625 [Oscillospiraceae bacterium]|nr:hypothetical protein [Oscillospiraceae bacterium]
MKRKAAAVALLLTAGLCGTLMSCGDSAGSEAPKEYSYSEARKIAEKRYVQVNQLAQHLVTGVPSSEVKVYVPSMGGVRCEEETDEYYRIRFDGSVCYCVVLGQKKSASTETYTVNKKTGSVS